ncbi:hypothetical protein [Flavobacterium terrisoli]|uniref:hypothetical protein n=1 Tax=Flavobacterium terrisoli TaxID=3242195 RepID=UPI0025433679|nr:hypothetical protein [Flavobacterium buctense]
MKKIALFIVSALMISCGEKKELLLPVAKETLVADIKEHSQIDFFFKIEEREESKDTLVEINRVHSDNSEIYTFNVDKRLPLRKVILELKKLQTIKEASKNVKVNSQKYFAYTDTVKKASAFMPFTKIHYKLEKPDFNVVHFHLDRNDLVHQNELVFSKNQLVEFIDKLPNHTKIYFSFDKGMSFGKYLEYKFFIKNLEIKKGITVNRTREYIY